MNTPIAIHQIPQVVTAELVVVGGGLAGLCAAVSAARNGVKTILVQDRPMPGGNSSSEIRMWICGATSPAYREGGLLEELKLANCHYNPTLKYTLWDQVMRDFLEREPNLECYFSTTVQEVVCQDQRIQAVRAWGLTDYLHYEFRGKYFADCSGDSILALSGAEYMVGREDAAVFQEPWGRPCTDAQTMGNSIILQLRRTGDNRPFHAPAWAYHYTDQTVPRPDLARPGDNFWWLEFGGVKDVIADNREITRELQRVALGYWEYIKNHPDGRGDGWSLDWIGSLAGKRESRRYVGDYILTQNDILQNRRFGDAVAYGGWPLDDHHPEAIYANDAANRAQSVPQGYHIPYRCLYSRNVQNLFFAGRNISVTHLGLSSTRVMATCATLGQAVGTAAAVANHHGCLPREVGVEHLAELQQLLMLQDQFLPGLRRQPSHAAQLGRPSDPRLVNGAERDDAGAPEDNALLLRAGASCSYVFPSATPVGGVRLVWDSNFQDAKRMRLDEGEDETHGVPECLGQAYRVEAKVAGKWKIIHQADDNFRRLDLARFPTVLAEELRLTLVQERVPGKPARLFAFEPLDP